MTDERKTYFNKNQAQNQQRPTGVLDEIDVTVGLDGREKIKKVRQHLQDPRTGRLLRRTRTFEEPLICENPLGLHELDREIDPKEARKIDDKIVCSECFEINKRRKLLNLFLSWIYEWETF